jgi:hypothetical protein
MTPTDDTEALIAELRAPSPLSEVSAGKDGGVCFVWEVADHYLYLDVGPNHTLHVYHKVGAETPTEFVTTAFDGEIEGFLGTLFQALFETHSRPALEASRSRVGVLEGVLRPFAEAAEEWASDDTGDEQQAWPTFMVGDFRRARAALETEPSKEPNMPQTEDRARADEAALKWASEPEDIDWRYNRAQKQDAYALGFLAGRASAEAEIERLQTLIHSMSQDPEAQAERYERDR